MEKTTKGGSLNNIWYGLGRQRIEIPKPVLKSRVIDNPILKGLYVASLGYYPRAEGHYTARKKGLHENFLFYCVDGAGWYKLGDKNTRSRRMNTLFCLKTFPTHMAVLKTIPGPFIGCILGGIPSLPSMRLKLFPTLNRYLSKAVLKSFPVSQKFIRPWN